jgi:nitroreductase
MLAVLSARVPAISTRLSLPRASRHDTTARVSVVSSASASGKGGPSGRAPLTFRVPRAVDPPSPGQHKNHLPLITGIEYDPTPPNAIKLPVPDLLGHHHAPFEHVVSSRRCVREFAAFSETLTGVGDEISDKHLVPIPSGQIHLYELAQLCWAAQGITAPAEPADEFDHAAAAKRAVASSGRLYPLTVYVVANQFGVHGVDPGVYEYLPHSHALHEVSRSTCCLDGERGAGDETVDENEEVAEDDGSNSVFAELIYTSAPPSRQPWASGSNFIMLIVGDARKTKQHGGLHETFGDDLVSFETGMVAATVQLQAVALGLGATLIAAFDANEASRVVFGDTKHTPGTPRLMLACGVPTGSYRERVGHVRWEDDEEEGEA